MATKTVYSNPAMERTGYFPPSVSHEDEVRTAVADLTACLEEDPSDELNTNLILKGLISVFKSVVIVIKVVMLISLSTVYFVVGSVLGIIYLIMYEKLFKTIFLTPGQRRNSSPYFYRWKKHHLELNYEV